MLPGKLPAQPALDMHQALLLHRIRPEMPHRLGDRLAAIPDQQQPACAPSPPAGPVADRLEHLLEHALAAFDLAVGLQLHFPCATAWKHFENLAF
jgi:hypothetical protein